MASGRPQLTWALNNSRYPLIPMIVHVVLDFAEEESIDTTGFP